MVSQAHVISSILSNVSITGQGAHSISYQVLDTEMFVIFDSNILWRSLVFMKVECAINKAVIR